jgi:hypothetical protein
MGHSIASGRLSARLSVETLKKIEIFAAQAELNQSEAIELLIELGLNAHKLPPSIREPVLPPRSFV